MPKPPIPIPATIAAAAIANGFFILDSLLDKCSLGLGAQHDRDGLHKLERLHHLFRRRLIFLEMIRSEVRLVGIPVAVDFEYPDMARIIFLGYRLQHQEARLLSDGGV